MGNHIEEYKLALSEVKKIEKIADDLRKTAKKKLEVISTQTLNDWKGEASFQFKNEVTETIAQLLKEADKLDSIARVAKKVADTNYQAKCDVITTTHSGGGGF